MRGPKRKALHLTGAIPTCSQAGQSFKIGLLEEKGGGMSSSMPWRSATYLILADFWPTKSYFPRSDTDCYFPQPLQLALAPSWPPIHANSDNIWDNSLTGFLAVFPRDTHQKNTLRRPKPGFKLGVILIGYFP